MDLVANLTDANNGNRLRLQEYRMPLVLEDQSIIAVDRTPSISRLACQFELSTGDITVKSSTGAAMPVTIVGGPEGNDGTS